VGTNIHISVVREVGTNFSEEYTTSIVKVEMRIVPENGESFFLQIICSHIPDYTGNSKVYMKNYISSEEWSLLLQC
jgi:hypothetical protein